MTRLLVVAVETIGGDELVDAVREQLSDDDGQLLVLVPATGVEGTSGTSAGVAAGGTTSTIPAADPGQVGTDESARGKAHNRLKQATATLEPTGATIEGDVSDPDPMTAIEQAVQDQGPFDGIVIAAPPAGPSKWIAMDLPSQVERRFDVPVSKVESPRTGDFD